MLGLHLCTCLFVEEVFIVGSCLFITFIDLFKEGCSLTWGIVIEPSNPPERRSRLILK